ncbi:MAG: hypothetical protein NTX53_20100 [candidate division WOR-3 bacterium]|nr:hypothetical protein [candidate division WOR-3 bacterium]
MKTSLALAVVLMLPALVAAQPTPLQVEAAINDLESRGLLGATIDQYRRDPARTAGLADVIFAAAVSLRRTPPDQTDAECRARLNALDARVKAWPDSMAAIAKAAVDSFRLRYFDPEIQRLNAKDRDMPAITKAAVDSFRLKYFDPEIQRLDAKDRDMVLKIGSLKPGVRSYMVGLSTGAALGLASYFTSVQFDNMAKDNLKAHTIAGDSAEAARFGNAVSRYQTLGDVLYCASYPLMAAGFYLGLKLAEPKSPKHARLTDENSRTRLYCSLDKDLNLSLGVRRSMW